MKDESQVQSEVRLALADHRALAYRNNVGAGKLENGNFIRWGLCNDSKQLNAQYKSGDLIGGRKRLITPDMVGTTILQFASWECKPEGWKYTGTDREAAQMRWRDLILLNGGHAQFTTSAQDLQF